MSHKSYKGSKNSKYKQPPKNYSWTWRFSDDAQDKLKMELKKILNNYISQKIKDKALIDLSNWQKKKSKDGLSLKGLAHKQDHYNLLVKTFVFERS